MTHVIYDKKSGKVLRLLQPQKEEDLAQAIAENEDFLLVDKVPEYTAYRQQLAVVNRALVVQDRILTAEEEKKITIWEAATAISHYKKLLADTDYQAIKFAEGEIAENDYAEMREKRRSYRAKINELEQKLDN